MKPRYPIYIVSKGRADNQVTSRTLSSYGVDHFVVVERSQLEQYGQHRTRHAELLALPERYLDAYDTFDNLGRTKSVGPGAARNFAWDHSGGVHRHWVMDDNIWGFWRYHLNRKIRMGDGTGIRVIEDFVDRYENIAMAGPNYFMFIARKQKHPPYVLNTRIYSCNLILNSAPYRWRGRYNEDTDLSLRMLKDGWCTVQFNAFLQWKKTTQIMGGGNTEAFYAAEGTRPKSEMLVKMHPDVARVTHKFSRIHHEVDYGPFRSNQLRRRPNLRLPTVQDDPYGLVLERRDVQAGRWVPMDERELSGLSSLQLGLGFA